jgi:hypothetical protein
MGHGPKSSPLPVFANKVLLEYSHAHLFAILSTATLQCMAELSSSGRDPMAPKPKHIYYLALYRKSLLIPP